MTQSEFLNKLYKEYGLAKEDIFAHRHYKIITRGGIEKIQAKSNIVINYEIQAPVSCPNNVVIKAVGQKLSPEGELISSIQTYASAHEGNCQSTYYAEMAEKRAMSRVVLKLEGAYEHGFFGEDEADDFKKSKSNATAGARVK